MGRDPSAIRILDHEGTGEFRALVCGKPKRDVWRKRAGHTFGAIGRRGRRHDACALPQVDEALRGALRAVRGPARPTGRMAGRVLRLAVGLI